MPVWDARARAASEPPRFLPTLINVVVIRKWPGRDDDSGGKIVFLTHTAVQQPLQPFDDDDDRSLLENGWIKEAKQQRDLGHLPQKTGRAVRVPVVFTLRLFVLTTAYGCRVSQGSPGRSRSAGTAGSASSCSGPATRSSCVPSTATVSFMWRKTRGSWASRLKQLLPGIGTHQELLGQNGHGPYDNILG